MKSFIVFVFCVLSSNSFALSGKYLFKLQLEKTILPFIIEFKAKKKETLATLFNGEETVELGKIEINESEFKIPFQTYNVALEAKINGDEIKGLWVKYDRNPAYQVPFIAKKVKSTDRITFNPTKEKIPNEWKITFTNSNGKKDEKLLLLSKVGKKIYGSVAGNTGDYRYLEGTIDQGILKLYGFDGVFAFAFEAQYSPDKIVGKMHAGKSTTQDFVAVIDNKFKLPDADKISKVNSKSLFFKVKDVNGKEVDINEKYYQNKVTVLQVFGSWCPNCIDETNFINKWRKEKPKSNVQFLGISFERSPNKKHAIKMVKKAIKKLNIDYDFYIGGYTSDNKVTDVLTNLENFKAFPTTIFIDKKGNVRKIHTGFNGPATGRLFTEFKKDFNQVIKKLSSE